MTGTYNRTCEAIALQVEHLQIDEVAELLGQLSCNTQVNVSKHTIHVCWGIRLALKLVVARIKVRQIDKVAKLLGKFYLQKAKMSANTRYMYAGTYKSHRRDHMRPS